MIGFCASDLKQIMFAGQPAPLCVQAAHLAVEVSPDSPLFTHPQLLCDKSWGAANNWKEILFRSSRSFLFISFFFFSNCLSLLPVLLLCSFPKQSDGAGWFTLWLKVMEEVSSPKKLACVDLWKVMLIFPWFLQADLAVEICNVLASKAFTASCANANISPPYSSIWGWSLGTRLKDQGQQGCWCCTIQDQGSQLYQVLTTVNQIEVSVTGTGREGTGPCFAAGRGSGQAAHADLQQGIGEIWGGQHARSDL